MIPSLKHLEKKQHLIQSRLNESNFLTFNCVFIVLSCLIGAIGFIVHLLCFWFEVTDAYLIVSGVWASIVCFVGALFALLLRITKLLLF